MIYSIDKNYLYNKQSNTVGDFFKNKFLKKSPADSFESKITKFYDELIKVSDNLGLGKNIHVDTVYDGSHPEKVFTIKVPFHIEREEKYSLLDQIISDMVIFSKENNMVDFFKDSYILIK